MSILPGYNIIEEIYEKNWLKIYRGYMVCDRSPVMIKTLKAGANRADISKLINEYEITRNFDIKGIIKPVHLKRVGLTVALIMEDNGDIPLRKHLQTSRPDLSDFFSIAIQLAEILGEIHQKGVIHRGLKPDNIFIHSGTGGVKIADFGMATLMSRKDQNEWISSISADTFVYMSPEQISWVSGTVDHRSDLYSLGMVLYEILTGQLPFQADNHIEWVHAHIAKKPVYPGEFNRDIPPAITSIIMKLLSKNAGERYQSAAGLLADLEECRRQWSQTGMIEIFALDQVELRGYFRLPDKLYGREKEAEILTEAFKRVCSGQSELLLVHGYAGTGKTVLIHEILRLLAVERGYFITGKSDQLQRNTPYAPFMQALGNLIRQILTESEERLSAWRRILLRALGKNGAVITEVIPEVELIVGSQPSVKILQPREAQNRFRMLFRKFVQAFTQEGHPLVLFLDDLQWADPASLNLVQYLCEAPDNRHFLLIGAYRSNEVTGTHVFQTTLTELQKRSIPIQHILLVPLEAGQTNQLIADSLHCSVEQSQPLAEIFHRKTGGNPFFLRQLLQSAYAEKLLRFNEKNGCWEWNPAAIHEMPMADDIINLMLGKLQKLPADTRNILKMAACIGNTFDLQTLAIVCELTVIETATALHPTITEGLILPIDCHGKPRKASDHINEALSVIDSAAKYEFLHDRVQQVAYSLIPEENKKEAHLQIGRKILQNLTQDELDEKMFDIMDHLNRGLDLIDNPVEKMKLAEYNLLAGQKAKASTAYGSALDYFRSGIVLLPDNAWRACFRLSYDLHLERAQCEYLCARIDIASQLFDLLMEQAETDVDRADIYFVKMVLCLGSKKYHETLQLGITGLKILGLNLVQKPGKLAFIKEMLLAKWRLRNGRESDCTDLPEMTDSVQRKIIGMLITQVGAAMMVNPELSVFMMLKVGNLSIKYRYTDFSSIGYVNYSFFFGSVLGNYKTGYEFEQRALKLVEKYNNSSAKSIFYFTIGLWVSHWTKHGSISVDHLQKAVDYGLESGQFFLGGYAMTLIVETKYLLGGSLEELYQECQRCYNFADHPRLLNYQLLIANLKGLTDDPFTLSSGDCEEADFRKAITDDNIAIMTYNFSKMQLYYLYGDYGNALAIAEEASPNTNIIRGMLLYAEYLYYFSLAITAGYSGLSGKQQRKYWKTLKKNQRQMKKWSNFCPANFLHKYLLVAAEMARLSGNDSEAMSLYDQSIQSAREHGYVQNEALASELAGRFFLAQGRDKIAQVYITDACRGYYRWGATRKARHLQEQYPHLLAGISMEEEEFATVELLKNVFQYTDFGETKSTSDLELYAIRKAVGKLSEETDPSTLLNSFLQIAIEHGGADKGYLILEKDEKLFFEAIKNSDIRKAAVLTPLPLEKNINISRAMVRYVARTLEPVVINDGEQTGIFTRDPYIAQSGAKSIICLPLVFQGIPVGVLYLENSLMAGVFTPERVEVLQLLSSQIAYIQKLQIFLDEDVAKAEAGTPHQPQIEPLTERELDVLSLIADGMSNKEIALGLQLTVNTVKTHILNIYGKLQVNRRVQAVTRAKELNLLKNERRA